MTTERNLLISVSLIQTKPYPPWKSLYVLRIRLEWFILLESLGATDHSCIHDSLQKTNNPFWEPSFEEQWGRAQKDVGDFLFIRSPSWSAAPNRLWSGTHVAKIYGLWFAYNLGPFFANFTNILLRKTGLNVEKSWTMTVKEARPALVVSVHCEQFDVVKAWLFVNSKFAMFCFILFHHLKATLRRFPNLR